MDEYPALCWAVLSTGLDSTGTEATVLCEPTSKTFAVSLALDVVLGRYGRSGRPDPKKAQDSAQHLTHAMDHSRGTNYLLKIFFEPCPKSPTSVVALHDWNPRPWLDLLSFAPTVASRPGKITSFGQGRGHPGLTPVSRFILSCLQNPIDLEAVLFLFVQWKLASMVEAV